MGGDGCIKDWRLGKRFGRNDSVFGRGMRENKHTLRFLNMITSPYRSSTRRICRLSEMERGRGRILMWIERLATDLVTWGAEAIGGDGSAWVEGNEWWNEI